MCLYHNFIVVTDLMLDNNKIRLKCISRFISCSTRSVCFIEMASNQCSFGCKLQRAYILVNCGSAFSFDIFRMKMNLRIHLYEELSTLLPKPIDMSNNSISHSRDQIVDSELFSFSLPLYLSLSRSCLYSIKYRTQK